MCVMYMYMYNVCNVHVLCTLLLHIVGINNSYAYTCV